jgi:hypothetical protein
MTTRNNLTAILACVLLSQATPVRADAVTYWNDVAVTAVTVGRPGGQGFVDMALVHAAMHDAVQAIQRRFQPYKANVQGAGSADAAAGSAAYGVLAGIYPMQRGLLDMKYKEFVAADGLTGNPGLRVGEQVAAALLKEHRPIVTMPDFRGGTGVGQWRPTPSLIGTAPVPAPFSPMAFVHLAQAKPYTLNSPSQFRPAAPPPLTSAEYLRDYNEVKALGSRRSTTRTQAQTDLAYFWAGNYVEQWNRALRDISVKRSMEIGDSARLFALANLAAADAAIACWDTKRFFYFWRPVTAIQEGERDNIPGTLGDPAWEPLINTPNYPDFTSGANSVTAAMTTTLEQFFGTDEFSFTITSTVPEATQKTRTYKRFSDAAQEVVDARILLGIHFRFADEVARTQGSNVARWTFPRVLRPVGGGRQ